MRRGEPGKDEGEMRVAFASLNENVDIWSLPLDSNRRTVTGGPQPLTTDLGEDIYADISRDGTKLAFVSARSGNAEIWLKDLRMAKETQVTVSGGRKTTPAFSASASKLAYTVSEAAEQLIYVVSLSQSGQPSIPSKVCSQCGGNPSWSPDDKSILNVEFDGSVRLVDTVSGQKTTVIEHQKDYVFWEPSLSPDGAWVAFLAQALARSRIYVMPFRADQQHIPHEWIAVTDGASWDDTPRWSPDGKAIYFISERDGFRCIWSQALDSATKHPVGAPAAVYHSHSARRSLLNVSLAVLSIAVANDKIVFNMGERTGNIWMATFDALF
jgi:eukaryotic-like serine/threonine-protein kinase